MFPQVVQKHQLGLREVGNKITLSIKIFSGIFLPKLVQELSYRKQIARQLHKH